MAQFAPIPGIPPNFSVMAALSAGLLPANAQINGFPGGPNTTVLAVLSAAGASGNQFSSANNGSQQIGDAGTAYSGGSTGSVGAVEVQGNMLESALTFASPPVFGGS